MFSRERWMDVWWSGLSYAEQAKLKHDVGQTRTSEFPPRRDLLHRYGLSEAQFAWVLSLVEEEEKRGPADPEGKEAQVSDLLLSALDATEPAVFHCPNKHRLVLTAPSCVRRRFRCSICKKFSSTEKWSCPKWSLHTKCYTWNVCLSCAVPKALDFVVFRHFNFLGIRHPETKIGLVIPSTDRHFRTCCCIRGRQVDRLPINWGQFTIDNFGSDILIFGHCRQRVLRITPNRISYDGRTLASYPNELYPEEWTKAKSGDIGLGFSGGGTRSSLICMGFLKAVSALDSQELFFQNLRTVSSVGGGGFAAASLLSSMYTKAVEAAGGGASTAFPSMRGVVEIESKVEAKVIEMAEAKAPDLRHLVQELCERFERTKERSKDYNPFELEGQSKLGLGCHFLLQIFGIALNLIWVGMALGLSIGSIPVLRSGLEQDVAVIEEWFGEVLGGVFAIGALVGVIAYSMVFCRAGYRGTMYRGMYQQVFHEELRSPQLMPVRARLLIWTELLVTHLVLLGLGYISLHLMWAVAKPIWGEKQVSSSTGILALGPALAAIFVAAQNFVKQRSPDDLASYEFLKQPYVIGLLLTVLLYILLLFIVALVALVYIFASDWEVTFAVWATIIYAFSLRHVLDTIWIRWFEVGRTGPSSEPFPFVNQLHANKLVDYYLSDDFDMQQLQRLNAITRFPEIDFVFNCQAELNNAYGADYQDFFYRIGFGNKTYLPTYGGTALGSKKIPRNVHLSHPMSLSAGAGAPTLGLLRRPYDSFPLRFLLFLLKINVGGYIQWNFVSRRTGSVWVDELGLRFLTFALHCALAIGFVLNALSLKRFVATYFFWIPIVLLLLPICWAFFEAIHPIGSKSFLHTMFLMLHRFPVSRTSPYLLLTDGGHFENLGGIQLLQKRLETIVLVDGLQDKAIEMKELARMLQLAQDRGLISSYEFLTDPTLLCPEAESQLSKADSRVLIAQVVYPPSAEFPLMEAPSEETALPRRSNFLVHNFGKEHWEFALFCPLFWLCPFLYCYMAYRQPRAEDNVCRDCIDPTSTLADRIPFRPVRVEHPLVQAGKIYYLKSAILQGDEKTLLLESMSNPSFPHDSNAQIDSRRWRAYLALGERMGHEFWSQFTATSSTATFTTRTAAASTSTTGGIPLRDTSKWWWRFR